MRVLPILTERLKRDGLRHIAMLAGGRIKSELTAIAEDVRRGVSTNQEVDQSELGFEGSCNHAYVATDYGALKKLFRYIEINPARDVFVDIGSGKGRVVVMAAGQTFRRVMGVEYSETLHQAALVNLGSLKKCACGSVELVCADAASWKIPDDATVLFFFNPFDGEVLSGVFRNIRKSLAEVPRKLTIIYVRPDKFFEQEIEWQSWLTRSHQFPYSDGTAAIYVSKV